MEVGTGTVAVFSVVNAKTAMTGDRLVFLLGRAW
jgi:hypothetical protein